MKKYITQQQFNNILKIYQDILSKIYFDDYHNEVGIKNKEIYYCEKTYKIYPCLSIGDMIELIIEEADGVMLDIDITNKKISMLVLCEPEQDDFEEVVQLYGIGATMNMCDGLWELIIKCLDFGRL